MFLGVELSWIVERKKELERRFMHSGWVNSIFRGAEVNMGEEEGKIKEKMASFFSWKEVKRKHFLNRLTFYS